MGLLSTSLAGRANARVGLRGRSLIPLLSLVRVEPLLTISAGADENPPSESRRQALGGTAAGAKSGQQIHFRGCRRDVARTAEHSVRC